MELQKHNDILTELEKLLDSNLNNVNPEEYSKLSEERDIVLQERDALTKALEETKLEADSLVDKVVATEEERDALQARLDAVSEGSTAFQTRITGLLEDISNLQAEVERRDKVVLKMAEKYQLVEKDDVGDSLVTDANNDGVPDMFQTDDVPFDDVDNIISKKT